MTKDRKITKDRKLQKKKKLQKTNDGQTEGQNIYNITPIFRENYRKLQLVTSTQGKTLCGSKAIRT